MCFVFKHNMHTFIIGLITDIPEDGPDLKTDVHKVAPGAHIRANCTTPGSFPRMNVTWFLNDVEVSFIAILPFVISVKTIIMRLWGSCLKRPQNKRIFS